jgi:hypothetical protein
MFHLLSTILRLSHGHDSNPLIGVGKDAEASVE